jgi:hypothetical protein
LRQIRGSAESRGFAKERAMTPEMVRSAVLDVAALQLGVADPSPFWRECFGQVPTKKLAWCGIFALYCLRQATGCNWTWAIGSGFLSRLSRTSHPDPGDVAYFDKPYQHHALLQKAVGDELYLIQGNYGFPGHVAESQCSISQKKPVFFSIQRLVDEAIEATK